jgi:hypothetical protein
MLLIVAALGVAIVAFIVYALERRAKDEPIVWEHAGKLSLFGGLVTAGIVFVTSADTGVITDTIASIEVPATQDMFVGIPTF